MTEQNPIDNSDKLAALRQALVTAQEQGQESVPVDSIIKAVDELQPHPLPYDARIEQWKAQIQGQFLEYQSRSQLQQETFRSAIASAQFSLKAVILINGGAAVALLAFVGQMMARGVDAASVAQGIKWYVFGVGAAGASTAGMYFAQYCYHRGFKHRGDAWRWISILLGISALIFFIYGSLVSYINLTALSV